MKCGNKEAWPRIPGHGVEGHPPEESLRWDETPLAAVRLARLQLPIRKFTTPR